MSKQLIKQLAAMAAMVCFFSATAFAQNKDVDKGNDILKKAFEQKDMQKKAALIQEAREHFMKGGMKSPEIAAVLGDAYLEAGDLQNAQNQYNAAGKEVKKDGLKKVADAWVENAFSGEEKARDKALNKAMNIYAKADATQEGARAIGDKFYEKGPDMYDKAVSYYKIGEASVKIDQIAKEYFDKGGDNEDKAAEVYSTLKSKEGFKKAGDIYYNRKEYGKAIEAYLAGGVGDGIKKYAEYLYSTHRNEEADNLILKLADAYAEKKDDDDMEALGKEVMAKGSFDLAGKIYDKAGNVSMKDKCTAYDALVGFRLDEAKSTFNNLGDAASVKMITDNEKVLSALKDVAENFDELMKGAPFVNLITDSVSGTSVPSASDQKTLEDYYKSIMTPIYNNVVTVSTNFAKLNGDDIKKYVKMRFNQYGAIRNILDPASYAVQKQKNQIKVKDILL